MTSPTLPELLTSVHTLVASIKTRDGQLTEWLAGTPTGGPNGDGRYPLTNVAGVTQLILCPAALADTISSPATSSQESAEASQDHAVSAGQSATTATDKATQAASSANLAASARDLALTYRNQAASERAAAQVYREQLGDISTIIASILARLDALESP